MSDIAFENLHNLSGDDLPDYIDKPLGDEEKKAVLGAKDHGVTEPVEILQFAGLEEFRKRQNNFYAHFAKFSSGSFLNLYRARRSFQRFEIIYPELTSKLLYQVSQMEPMTEEQWRDLFDAYQKMSELVDRKDGGIAAEIAEGYSKDQLAYYLCA